MRKNKNKQLQKTGAKETSIVRSSAAEYLTFVAATGKGGVEAVYADENIWLSQQMMGVLYDVNVRTVNEHLKKIFADSELQEDSVIRKFRITASDGKNYNTNILYEFTERVVHLLVRKTAIFVVDHLFRGYNHNQMKRISLFHV